MTDDGTILAGLVTVAVVAGIAVKAMGSRTEQHPREGTGMHLQFPFGDRPAVARVGAWSAAAMSADEAVALVAYDAYRAAREADQDQDTARRTAWEVVRPLVDLHRYELDDHGDAVAAILDDRIASGSPR